MRNFSITNWFGISLLNFFLIAVVGVLMRYKIGFEFPYLDQKNLQHAHSHFAFTGWVSQALMAMMVAQLQLPIASSRLRTYHLLLWCYLVVAIGMLISFAIQGYGQFSIVFSTASIILSYFFAFFYWADMSKSQIIEVKPWLKAALVFNLLSTCGTFSLVQMMATKTIEQHAYLASVYWYLHFQYNGWFFFAGIGLFLQYIYEKLDFKIPSDIFWKFSISCIPVYGLSVLWLDIPVWIYVVVVIAAVLQTIGWLQLLILLYRNKEFKSKISSSTLGSLLLIFLALAITIKISLQLGSVIPAISKLAFGFRPIVIAYLHLVLLAIISVLLLTNAYLRGYIQSNRLSHSGILVLLSGIFLNEMALAVQGIASFSYTMVPYINLWLLFFAIIMLLGIGLLLVAHVFRKTKVDLEG